MNHPFIRLISLGLMGALLSLTPAFSQTSQPSLKLTTEPETGKLPYKAESHRPQSPTKLSLQVLDPQGRPLREAQVRVQLLAPAANPWLPTDFPVVEGTKLLDLTAKSATGTLQLEQMLPIRGTYTLQVEVNPDPASRLAPLKQTLSFTVGEHPNKVQNYILLLGIVFGVGLTGGLLIGGKQQLQAGEVVPEKVRLLLSGAIGVTILSLLWINVSAELADSHPGHSGGEATPEVVSQPVNQSTTLKVEWIGQTQARVGEPIELGVRAIDIKTGKPATDVVFQVRATHLEHQWTAFAYTATPDPQGRFIWKQQFFDGAPHRIEVNVTSSPGSKQSFQPLQITPVVEVEGVAPPISRRFIALTYLMGVLGIGLAIGLGWRHWQDQKQRLTLDRGAPHS